MVVSAPATAFVLTSAAIGVGAANFGISLYNYSTGKPGTTLGSLILSGVSVGAAGSLMSATALIPANIALDIENISLLNYDYQGLVTQFYK
jgi:hypothetical protein